MNPVPTLGELAAFAQTLADAARAETLAHWQGYGDVVDKGRPTGVYDPVTKIDVAAERAMRTLIADRYPDHGISGEEFGERASANGLTWSLDPIDGTRSYVCGLPTWVTLIALLQDRNPVIGLIDAPRLNERYLAAGNGTRLLPDGRLLATSACDRLDDTRLSTTDPDLFAGAEAEAFRRVSAACRIKRFGHDGYAYARLAAGSIDLVIEAGLQPYDLMALIPVVRGAGGSIGNWRGEADLSEGKVVAAATSALFAAAIAELNA